MLRLCAMCAAMLILMLSGGCASSRTQIHVLASPVTPLEIDDGLEFDGPEFCGHGQPLSPQGLALLRETDVDAAPRLADAEIVALTTFGAALRPRSARPGAFFLGAGDSLGQSVFGTYAVYARAERARELNEVDQSNEAIVSGEPVGE